MAKMWAGRTDGATEKLADDFNSSIHFDCRMYREDITGSMAHAAMLAAKGIISQEDADRLVAGLEDILSDLDIRWFESCVREEALATLLVSERKTSRYLLFEPQTMLLVGWNNVTTGEVRSPYPDLDPSRCLKLAFSGIHILSDKVFDVLDTYAKENGLYQGDDAPRFPIIDFYLSVCAHYKIYGVKADALHLVDVGKLDTIEMAEREFLRLT